MNGGNLALIEAVYIVSSCERECRWESYIAVYMYIYRTGLQFVLLRYCKKAFSLVLPYMQRRVLQIVAVDAGMCRPDAMIAVCWSGFPVSGGRYCFAMRYASLLFVCYLSKEVLH